MGEMQISRHIQTVAEKRGGKGLSSSHKVYGTAPLLGDEGTLKDT